MTPSLIASTSLEMVVMLFLREGSVTTVQVDPVQVFSAPELAVSTQRSPVLGDDGAVLW